MLERQLTSRSIMNSMNLSQYWTFSMETEPRATWTIKHTLKQWWHASFHSHRQTGTAFWGGRWIWVRREKQWRDRVTVLWWSPGLLRVSPSSAWTGGWWEEGMSACVSGAVRGARGRASAALKLGHVTGWWKHGEILKAEINHCLRGGRKTEALWVTETSHILTCSTNVGKYLCKSSFSVIVQTSPSAAALRVF